MRHFEQKKISIYNMELPPHVILGIKQRGPGGRTGDVCMREAVSRHSVRCVHLFSRAKRTFVPHVLQKMWGRSSTGEWRGWSKKCLVSSASFVLLLVHRMQDIKERQSKSCIFSVTECVLLSEKIQKFLQQGSPCWSRG